MPETTPLIKAALNLRGGAGFDVYSLQGRTPYDVALETLGEETLKAFQLRRIAPDEVNLTPKLIRFTR